MYFSIHKKTKKNKVQRRHMTKIEKFKISYHIISFMVLFNDSYCFNNIRIEGTKK